MNKLLSTRIMFVAFTAFLSGSFCLQSCTEEMPILTPPTVTTFTTSYVEFKLNNKRYTIIDKTPGYVNLSNITVGSGNNLATQHNVSGSNGNQLNPIQYMLNFSADTTSSAKYTFATSQLSINNKSYISTNPYGKAQLQINQLDNVANTAQGTFAYYLYNSVSNPTDSIYISGTFEIK